MEYSNRNSKTLEPEYVWWLDDDVVDEPASNVDTPSNVVDMAWKQLELLGDSDHEEDDEPHAVINTKGFLEDAPDASKDHESNNN